MSDCIFCKIVAGAIPARIAYRDEETIAIEDLNPQAPVHLLVMPRDHTPNVYAFGGEDAHALGRVTAVAARLGQERGANGFRLVMNTGTDGGQTVDHLHIHVLAGRHMTWPPG